MIGQLYHYIMLFLVPKFYQISLVSNLLETVHRKV